LSTGGVSSLVASGGLARYYSSTSSTTSSGAEDDSVEGKQAEQDAILVESGATAETVSGVAERCSSLEAAQGSNKHMQQLLLAALLPVGAVAVAAVCGALGHNHRYKRASRSAAAAVAPAAGPITSSSPDQEV
jgi:hypothetical protein